ncbi:MAG: hypothetical protein OET79_04200, partial [Nitrospirota bacterium]|nr:hypothetical protein [Nitrospirota bacterium]
RKPSPEPKARQIPQDLHGLYTDLQPPFLKIKRLCVVRIIWKQTIKQYGSVLALCVDISWPSSSSATFFQL